MKVEAPSGFGVKGNTVEIEDEKNIKVDDTKSSSRMAVVNTEMYQNIPTVDTNNNNYETVDLKQYVDEGLLIN